MESAARKEGELAALRRENAALLQRAEEAEQALDARARGELDSRQLLRAIFDGALDAIVLADDRATYVDVNPAACALFGQTREELIGRRVAVFAAAGPGEPAGFTSFRERGHAVGVFPFVRPDGTTCVLEFSAVANVVPGRHLSILRDITARKQADAALRESRDQLEEAQTLAHLGQWSAGTGPDDMITWSTECARTFGVTAGMPVTKEAFFASVHPADRPHLRGAIAEMLVSDRTYDVEHRVQWTDGTIRWVHSRAIVDRDTAGRPTRMHGSIQDITARHLALDALKASEERYRRIVENTSEGVWMYDARRITTFMNRRMAEMLGYALDEVVGEPIFLLMDPAQHEASAARADRRMLGLSERSDFVLRRKDGTEILTSIQASPLLDVDGRFECALALVRDVSTERRAEADRAQLAAIVESSNNAIIGASPSGAITSWNTGAEKLYQYRADEMVGRSLLVLVPADLQDTERGLLEAAARGESAGIYNCERLCKDGSLVTVAVTISPIRDASRAVTGVSTIARDLTALKQAETELRRTEDQLRQAQKMEAVGRLAGGVAHDFNNLLTVILSYAEFALEDLLPGDPLRDAMVQIDQAGKRATELTRQLLAFSRQQVLQPRVVDLNHIVLGMERMLHRLIGEDVALALHADPSIGLVLTDPSQLEQVVMNLAVNARDAMPEGGSFKIETSAVRIAKDHTSGPAGIAPGDYVMLATTDTGIGMDAATCARVFEPFFTTKGPGKGTGLGLSTVFGIVQQSGGYVGVTSEPGRGTRFEIYLPRTETSATSNASSQPIARLRGTETILLVEDEEQVRTVACAILRRNGYTVLDTSNGGEAFLESKGFAGTIHLLLTDVVMPRMSGPRLAAELALVRPAMKVLYASGYTDDAMLHHGVLDGAVAFVQKPFTPDALLRKVREVLGPPSARS